MPSLLLLVLAATSSIRVRVEGPATEVVAFHRGDPVARAAVRDGVAEIVAAGFDAGEADLVALGPGVRSELVRRVRLAEGDGFDAVLEARPCHTLRVKTEEGAWVYVGGARFPAEAVPLLPGLHRIVVDHERFVSSASRLVRIDGDAALEVALESGLAVQGVVRGADGEPLAGARVEVFSDGFDARRSAASDARGRFAVSGFRGRVVSLRIAAPGHATRLVRVAFEPGSERARADARLERGADVTLPVSGPVRATLLPRWLDRALEEPRLLANDEAPRVNAEDRARFEGLSPGRSYRILVEAPGCTPVATEPFEAAPGLVLPRLATPRGARLSGRLDGPGRFVVCRGAAEERVCRTDRAGRWEFAGLLPGKVVLFVRDVDERGLVVDVAAAEDRAVAFPAAPEEAPRFLEGTVLDADRQPLPGVEVAAAGRTAVTDEQGAFRLGPLPPGPGRFPIALEPRPGSRAFAKDPHLPRVEEKAQPGIVVRAQLERVGRLDLRFPGTRLARATLLLEGTSGARREWRIPRGAERMLLDELPVGNYVVEVSAPGVLGTGGVVHRAEPGEPKPCEVPVLRGRTVTGRVVRRVGVPREGRPPQRVDTAVDRGSVTLFDGARQYALATAPIAADGTFVLEGLPEAAVLVCAAVPGHPVGVTRVDLEKADVAGLVIPVFAPMPGGVTVQAPDGRAVLDVRIAVLEEYGFDVRDLAARARYRGVVADDDEFADIDLLFRLVRREDGGLEHRGLAPGNYEFRVFAAGYKQGVGKVRVRAPWTLEHIGSLLPEFSNPLVPVWLEPADAGADGGEKPGGD